jgi:predicted nucleic acid-binding protein
LSDVYVIDTSVLIQAYVSESETRRVQTLLNRLDDEDDSDELHVLEMCLIECGNVFWKHVRLHGMPLETARRNIKRLLSLPLIVHPSRDYLVDAFEIGITHQLAVYDALYIMLAKSLSLPLITTDAKQASVAQAEGVTLKPITDFPEYQEPGENS